MENVSNFDEVAEFFEQRIKFYSEEGNNHIFKKNHLKITCFAFRNKIQRNI